MLKILFIDEEKDAMDAFRDYIEDNSSTEQVQVETEFPLGDKAEMIDLIIQHNPDAIVSDFNLNDIKTDIQHNVPYDGVELVQAFSEIRKGFPCFIITSFDDDAVNKSEDVNIVYIKDILHKSRTIEADYKAKFIEKIKCQVMHYQHKIAESEKRIQELLKLVYSGKANSKEEQELIDLDTFLEGKIDSRTVIPNEFKTLSNSQRISELITKVDDLINSVDKQKTR